jgi:hypothetical protein
MVLVDTSIWIRHFHQSEPALVSLLNSGSVACHPFIVGELAAGTLKCRAEILSLFNDLPSVPVVESEEYLDFLEVRNLMGKGLSFVGIHLLASAVLAGVAFWTGDRKLSSAAKFLGIGLGI